MLYSQQQLQHQGGVGANDLTNDQMAMPIPTMDEDEDVTAAAAAANMAAGGTWGAAYRDRSREYR